MFLEVWRDLGHFLEKAVRIDVTIDVDNGLMIFLPRLFSAPNAAAAAATCQPKRSAISPHSPFGAHSMTTMATAPIISR